MLNPRLHVNKASSTFRNAMTLENTGLAPVASSSSVPVSIVMTRRPQRTWASHPELLGPDWKAVALLVQCTPPCSGLEDHASLSWDLTKPRPLLLACLPADLLTITLCAARDSGGPHWSQLRLSAASVKEMLSKSYFKCVCLFPTHKHCGVLTACNVLD